MTVKSISPPEVYLSDLSSPRFAAPKRILLVASEVDDRRMNSSSLQDAGYEVDAFEDGAQAWDAIERNHYDLMITDQHVPTLSGVELLRKIYEARLGLPVIMATAILPTWEFVLNPWLQAATMLQKPYQPGNLLTMVNGVFSGVLSQPAASQANRPLSSNRPNPELAVEVGY